MFSWRSLRSFAAKLACGQVLISTVCVAFTAHWNWAYLGYPSLRTPNWSMERLHPINIIQMPHQAAIGTAAHMHAGHHRHAYTRASPPHGGRTGVVQSTAEGRADKHTSCRSSRSNRLYMSSLRPRANADRSQADGRHGRSPVERTTRVGGPPVRLAGPPQALHRGGTPRPIGGHPRRQPWARETRSTRRKEPG